MTYMNSGIKSMRGYADALHQWNNTKHIRGRGEDQRPLGRRSMVNSFRILKRGDNIECILYQTPVVTFTPEDNIVIRINGWPSGSTAKFILEVLFYAGITARKFDGSIVLTLPDHKEYRLNENDSHTLTRVEGGFTMDTYVPQTVHMINRKAKREVLERYRDATEYLYAFAKLRAGDRISAEEVNAALSDYPYRTNPNSFEAYSKPVFTQRVERFKKWASSSGEDKHNDFYKLAMLHVAGSRLYLDTYVHTLMGIHRDEVFKEVEVPAGEIKRDAHKWYFSSHWDDYHNSQNT